MKSIDRAQLRKQLLANGYRPLPLLDKGIRIPGWTRAEIDADWLAPYERSNKYKNTGIRCDDLIAFDIDVLDEDLANEIEDFIEEKCGPTDLCRVGCWPKRLLLYRVVKGAGMDRSARTGKYGGHQVELLATFGRQFAAFGTHPGTGREYEWLDGFSPLNTTYSELPELSPDGAMQCLKELDELLAATGLERTSPGGRRGIEGANLYDLQNSLEVLLVDGSEITWGELKRQLDSRGEWGNLRRENGEWGDSDGVHFYIAEGIGEACIHDFARDVTHWDSPSVTQTAQALPPQPGGMTMFGDKTDHLAELRENYVLLGDKTVRVIDQPEMVYTSDGFALLNAWRTVSAPTARNPNATQPAVTAWLKDPDTERADRAALRPDHPDDVIVRDGKLKIFNTYVPIEHPARGGELDTLMDFLRHLIPNDHERTLFIDWHAYKIANPHWRMHGMLTVTPTQGTGRGVWLQILSKLLGAQYVHEIELHDLVGDGSQAQYNEFLATSLIVYVPEALEVKEGKTTWQQRHMAYERLKAVCDPVAGKMYVKRKYGRNSTERVFASVLISSNHNDALAIDAADRRLVVLDNTETPLPLADDALYERILDWMDRPANIGALERWLLECAKVSTYDPFGPAPSTPAKARMIESSQSDLDRLYSEFVETAKGDICTSAQWRQFVYEKRNSGEYDLPTGQSLEAGINAVIAKKACRISNSSGGQLKINGRNLRPWIVRNAGFWKVQKGSRLNDKARAAVLANGDPGGSVIKLP